MSGRQRQLFPSDDAAVRARWRELVDVKLPDVAPGRGWPVHLNHCFARVLLDSACERPWREAIRPPAWKNAPIDVLSRAIELGEAVLRNEADLHRLNRKSLTLRGHSPGLETRRSERVPERR
ncbi:MAG: GCN5-related N-acetyltransferase [Myxococcota bacterium]